MKYRPLYINREHYYSVGKDEESGEWLIEVIITWIAWYSIFFRLTAEEVERFSHDNNALTDLSYELAADKGRSKFRDRLVLTQRPADLQ